MVISEPSHASYRPKVAVLLPTYNGQEFLPALLDSLVAQKDVSLTLLTADDGSTDSSQVLVDARADVLDVRRLQFKERLGVPGVFLSLLDAPLGRYDFVAYCDQDDIWHPGKLAAAARAMAGVEEPTLFVSEIELLSDSGNREVPQWMRAEELRKGLSRVILGNVVPGCTMVMNQPLVERVKRGLARRNEIVAHDWFTALVALVSGRVVAWPDPLVQYRLHGENTVGIPSGQRRLLSLAGRLGTGLRQRVAQLDVALEAAKPEGDLRVSTLARRAFTDALFGRVAVGRGVRGHLESVARAGAFLLAGGRK